MAVTLSACTDASRPATTTVVDSAGVQVVTNLPGSIEAVEAWLVSAEPVVDIGSGATPDVPLFRVTAVQPLDGGRVAVGTNTPPQVLVFEPDGTLAVTLGRAGEGPGEFSAVASVVPLGADSLAVWDDHRRRMSVFTGNGRFAREVDLSALALLSPIAAPSTEGLAAWTYLLPSTSGALVLFAVGAFGPGAGVRRVEVPSHRISADGVELAKFGPFPGYQSFMSRQAGVLPFPFGASTYGAASGDAFVVGTAKAPEFRMYAPTGELERIVRWPDHDRTVGGPLLSRWSDWMDAQLAAMPDGRRAAIRELLDLIPQADRFPAYDGIVTGDTGMIWVGEYPGQLGLLGVTNEVPRVPERRWLVFGADGTLVARVQTPEGFQPHAVRNGRVWGVYRDELDVESVRAYDFVKR